MKTMNMIANISPRSLFSLIGIASAAIWIRSTYPANARALAKAEASVIGSGCANMKFTVDRQQFKQTITERYEAFG
jgi:hypothetical protein